jgi:hypothetical protein
MKQQLQKSMATMHKGLKMVTLPAGSWKKQNQTLWIVLFSGPT